MYPNNLGPGLKIALDAPSSTGIDILLSHDYVAKHVGKELARKTSTLNNLYQYTTGNPLNRIDPTGLQQRPSRVAPLFTPEELLRSEISSVGRRLEQMERDIPEVELAIVRANQQLGIAASGLIGQSNMPFATTPASLDSINAEVINISFFRRLLSRTLRDYDELQRYYRALQQQLRNLTTGNA